MIAARQPDAVVHIVEDDANVREALSALFASVDRASRGFPSAQAFLEQADPQTPGCLLSDVRLPAMGGLELQARLAEHGFALPVVLMSGHADIQMTVRGLKAGAIDFLVKPLRDQDVLDATDAAIARDHRDRAASAERSQATDRYATLTPRERQVIALVIQGKTNVEVAVALTLSEVTVKIHRGSAMRKLGARRLANLVNLDRASAGLLSAKSPA